MTQFLAIVADTWRQSVRQVVFIIMLIVFTLLTVGMVIILKPLEPVAETPPTTTESVPDVDPESEESEDGESQDSDGPEDPDGGVGNASEFRKVRKQIEELGKSERSVGWVFTDDRFNRWREWNMTYLMIKKIKAGERIKMEDMNQLQFSSELFTIEDEIVEKTGLTRYERTVQMMCQTFCAILFMFAMWFFIAACSGYFPGLMASGAVDVVLAKPMTRLKIFIAKYIGGMFLLSAALLFFHFVFYVGIGLRLDVWHVGIFKVLPLEIFVAGLLYAILAFLGILFRSTIVPMLAGYFFYLVVDTALGAFTSFQRMGMFDEGSTLDVLGKWSRRLLPNFTVLKDSAANATLAVPIDSEPFWTAGCWFVITLALGYWRFQRRDF